MANPIKTCIVIGSYKLPQFAELCGLRCRRLWGNDTPILISDDFSYRSPQIEKMADRHGFEYSVGDSRRSHFSGDMQTFINGLQFAQETGADCVLKLSQRMIPVLPAFKEAMELAFDNPECQVVLPGQIGRNEVVRPSARFYSKFGILTDAVGLRSGAITPEELVELYRNRCGGKSKISDSFAETTFGFMLSERFAGSRHKILSTWTHHVPKQPKAFLRKAQSTLADYVAVAAMENLIGEWDLREWLQIEGKGYKGLPDCV